jgi:recombination protein RecT
MTNEVMPAQAELHRALKEREPQIGEFLKASGIAPERFLQSLYSALRNNPGLMRCTRQSLVNAALKAAEDQLMPDGIEGAIVPYREGDGGDQIARWLPMIQGITKKVLQHPEIKSWECDVVQDGDTFDYSKGSTPFLHHKKSPSGGRKRPVQFAYAIAHFVNGGISIEVMNVDEISDVASKSRAKHGPWQDPIFYSEMCRKTVGKLHAKRLPKTGALELLLQRDDDMYDLTPGRAQGAPISRALPTTAKEALDQFGSSFQREPAAAAPTGDKNGAAASADVAGTPREEQKAPQPKTSRGDQSACQSVKEYREHLEAVLNETTDADELHEWFFCNAQRDERVRLGMSIKQYEELRGIVGARVKELGGRKSASSVA